MDKFNFINYSIPLSQMKIGCGKIEEMDKTLSERVLETPVLNDIPYIRWDAKIGAFKLDCDFKDIGHDDNIISPKYAMRQLFADMLNTGDITRLFEVCDEVDKKLPKRHTQPDGNISIIDRHDNEHKMNKVVSSIWDIKRRKNRRTRDVICHKVVDVFGESIRAFVTGAYVHKEDLEVLRDVNDHVTRLNVPLKYNNGYLTPLMMRANFVLPNPSTIDENNGAVIGVSVVNSEFKYASATINSYLHLPNRNISLIGTTKRLTYSVRHVGDATEFNKKLNRGIDLIINRGTEFLDSWHATTRGQLIEVDMEKKDEDGNKIIGGVLGINKDIVKELVEIKTIKSYPNDIRGVIYSIMDYRENKAKTESERRRLNDKALNLVLEPKKFLKEMGRRVSRGDLIEVARDKPTIGNLNNDWDF